MDEVEKAGLVVGGTRADLLGNTLVLVAHGKDAARSRSGRALIWRGFWAMASCRWRWWIRFRRANTGKESLETLKLWAGVEGSVAQSENVRAALALVSTGEAPFGIVYASDAIADENVTVVGTFPADSHKPILYPAALLTGAADEADRAFLEALSADAADAKFTEQGFLVLN